jgi:peptide/nickel transport system substrate-binding protein
MMHRLHERFLASLATVAALASMIVLSACGGDASSQAGGASANSTRDIPALSIAFGNTGVGQLDRGKNISYPTTAIQALGLENLVQFDQHGKLVPWLAEKVDQPNPRTYVYTLRKGVRFWDGQPLTTADVVASLNRYRAAGSVLAPQYTSVASVAATGSDQVTVTLKHPDGTWPFKSAFATPIVEKRFAHAHRGDIGSPQVLNMGTGPFEFKSYVPNQNVVLAANPHWWNGHVRVERLTIELLPSPTSIALALRSGSVDGTFTLARGTTGTYANIPGTTLKLASGITLFFISMNTSSGPWSDIHVRRAIAHLVDRPAICDAAYQAGCNALDTPVPPSLLGSIASPSEVRSFYDSYRKYPFSIAAAQQEMRQSAYPHGFSTTWLVYDDSAIERVAQIMAQNMSKLGIRVKIVVNTAQFLSNYFGPRKDIGILATGYSNPSDPTYFYNLFLNSANAVVNGSDSADFKNADADRALQAATESQDPHGMLAPLQRLAQINAEQVPYIVVGTQPDGLVLSNRYAMPTYSDYWQVRPWALDIVAR